jgi:hypothetical protein
LAKERPKGLITSFAFENRYKEKHYKLLLRFAIARLVQGLQTDEEVTEVSLVIGLPTADYYENEKQIGSYLAEFLCGPVVNQSEQLFQGKTFTVTIGDTTRAIKVQSVNIIPQVLGVLFDMSFDEKGNVAESSLIEKNVGVADLGFGTKLFAILDRGILEKSATLEKGVFLLQEDIQNKAIAKGVFVEHLHDINKILRSRDKTQSYFYQLNDKTSYNFTEIVKEAKQEYTDDTISELKAFFRNHSLLDAIVFTGGGAELIDLAQVRKAFPNTTILKGGDEFSNVEGYWKRGQLIWEQE